ncbi:large neutral amino acids transporter small subunit 1-like isoform X2 [Acanthaster planci]|uniref:Large neutral amino acids transporter small subunit 1-like isoform X2 n=1 Tax=Acanthaster planci TaxID=133434 RepID=A0A8B7YNP9_ACAPL|nr:large neutral amino acids transporter small subunit 1-like isoform X2 [Acanthaster planci]
MEPTGLDPTASSENHSVKGSDKMSLYSNSGSSSVVSDVKLLRKVSLLNAVTVIVGSIVGSGIFISPVGVLANSGSAGSSVLIWAACGAISLVGALCYAELGTTLSESGGDFTYIRTAFGSLPGFLYLWVTMMVAFPSQQAIIALTFANYVSLPFYPEPECPPSIELRSLLAAVCLVTLTIINGFSVRMATRVQDVFTLGKMLALILIIVMGIIELTKGTTTSFQNSFDTVPGLEVSASGIAQAIYAGLFAYGGWSNLNFLTEELQNPNRNMPLAIIIAVPVVTTVYVLANISYLAAMSPQELLISPAVALTFGEKVLGAAAVIMPVSVALSTFGAVNGMLMASSRLSFVGARSESLPQVLGMIHVGQETPLAALAFMCFMSLMYLFAADIGQLLNYFNFVFWTGVGVSITGMLFLRWRRPDLERPLKVPWILPVIFVLVCIFLVVFGTIGQPMDTLIGLCISLTGVPVYFFGVYWTSKPKWLLGLIDAATVAIQRTLLLAPEHTSKSD